MLRNAQLTMIDLSKGKLAKNWDGPYIIKKVSEKEPSNDHRRKRTINTTRILHFSDSQNPSLNARIYH